MGSRIRTIGSAVARSLLAALLLPVMVLGLSRPAEAIFGGAEVEGQAPAWMVGIRVPKPQDDGTFNINTCGGVLRYNQNVHASSGTPLVWKLVVLTAKHCVEGADFSLIQLDFGSNPSNFGANVPASRVSQYFLHPVHDLAILEVDPLSEDKQRTYLPTSNTIERPAVVSLMGWGSTLLTKNNRFETYRGPLKQLELSPLSPSDCDSIVRLGKQTLTEVQSGEVICTVDASGSNGFGTPGDSGGPLVAHDPDGKAYLDGIVRSIDAFDTRRLARDTLKWAPGTFYTPLALPDVAAWESDIIERNIQSGFDRLGDLPSDPPASIQLESTNPVAAANKTSFGVDISNDGLTTVFSTEADNLIIGDPPQQDIAVRKSNGSIEILSKPSYAILSNSSCYDPVISGSGEFVYFTCDGAQVGSEGLAGRIYRRNIPSGVLQPLLSSDGTPLVGTVNGVSTDGQTITFTSTTDLTPGETYRAIDQEDAYVWTYGGPIKLVSQQISGVSTYDSHALGITPDGTKILFRSRLANLLPGLAEGVPRLYVHDVATGTKSLVAPDRTEILALSGAISPTGRYVAWFEGRRLYLWESTTNVTRAVSETGFSPGDIPGTGLSAGPGVDFSADGQFLVWNGVAKPVNPTETRSSNARALRLDLTTGVIIGMNAGSRDAALADQDYGGELAVSANGTRIAFSSIALRTDARVTDVAATVWQVYSASPS